MKLAITLIAIALSSQALADCAQDKPEQPRRSDVAENSGSSVQPVAAAQRRQMALDCMMRPAPFVQELPVIELEHIKGELVMEADPYPETQQAVATNS